MPLTNYVEKIKQATTRAKSESKLEGELNHILKDCLAEFGIDFDPHVNETLKSMGLAQVDADRPDGVFGHIVYDYKAPKALFVPKKLAESKSKVEEYLDAITGGHAYAPEEYYHNDHTREALPVGSRRGRGQTDIVWRNVTIAGSRDEHPAEIH